MILSRPLVTNDDNFEGPEIEVGQNDPNDEVESVENDIDNKENREDENIDQAEVNDLGKSFIISFSTLEEWKH